MQSEQPGTIWIDPEEGYLPHFCRAFIEAYGEESLFVRAAADCLSDRHTDVLIRAGKLPADSMPLRIGLQESFGALVALMRKLHSRGVEKTVVTLMQCALGHRDPYDFAKVVDGAMGETFFERWRHAIERREFVSVATLLADQ